MLNLDPTKLLIEHRRGISRLLRSLARKLPAIERDWRARLGEFGVSAPVVDLLAALTIRKHRSALGDGRWSAYCDSVERVGRKLEQRGVPLELALAGLGLHEECCVERLKAVDTAAWSEVEALSRLTSTTGILVLAGYSRQRASSWRRLDERDRQRLSRDLHDEIGHNLIVLKLYLEMIAGDLDGSGQGTVRKKIEEATELVGQSIDSVRRLMLDLGPAVLEEVGLVRAIRIYADEFTKRTPIRVRVQTRKVPDELPSSYETALYRVYQGALSNVAKHSRAKKVTVRISGKASGIRLVVEDDGIGFDIQRKLPPEKTLGLTAIRERIELLGGSVTIESWPMKENRERHGTRISVELPMEETAEHG